MCGRRTIGFFFCAFLVAAAGSAAALRPLDVWRREAADARRIAAWQSEAAGGQYAAAAWSMDALPSEDGWYTAGSSLLRPAAASAKAKELSLHATAAVLMDADSGRVLYGKNENAALAMASTTKIMTCITVLEQVEDLGEMAAVSAYAASMPQVKLFLKKGERYQVRELLFSLMLESHNDSAAVLAEYVGKRYLEDGLADKDTAEFTADESRQAVLAFAALMNAKADAIGCSDTYFITPNGLDATLDVVLDSGESVAMEHHTTAADLARIMAYCIMESPKRDLFLEITRTASYGFTRNGRAFVCHNHNAFLGMMDGALSGKTGFTNKAGYCYVGALRRDERTFIVALLACGWPDNKSYKWQDTRKLMEYGLSRYQYREFVPKSATGSIFVENGAAADGSPYTCVNIPVVKQKNGMEEKIRLLVDEGESVIARAEYEKSLTAPVAAGRGVGKITYYLVDGAGRETYLKEETLCAGEGVAAKDFAFMARYIFRCYALKCQNAYSHS